MIVGLDTSSKRWAAVSLEDGFESTRYYDAIGETVDERRATLAVSFRAYVEGLPQGTHIFCEEPLLLAKNWITTRQLALACGALWAQIVDLDLTWYWVGVSTWKSQIIGNGSAPKDRVARYFNNQGIVYDPIDLYDAHAIAMYGQMQLDAMNVG